MPLVPPAFRPVALPAAIAAAAAAVLLTGPGDVAHIELLGERVVSRC